MTFDYIQRKRLCAHVQDIPNLYVYRYNWTGKLNITLTETAT